MEIRTPEGVFSESFNNIHVVAEIEAGWITQAEANRKFGILGHSTIHRWLRKYGTLKPRHDTP